MNKNDWKEMSRWAVLSGAVVFATIGAAVAWGRGPKIVPPGTTTFGGCEYMVNATGDSAKGIVTGTLTVTNKGTIAATPSVHIGSVDRTFKGSLVSRTVKPDDFSEVEIQGKDVKLKLAQGATKTATFSLKFNVPKVGIPGSSPAITVSVGGKRVLTTGFVAVRAVRGPAVVRQ